MANLDQWILDRFEGDIALEPGIDFQFARLAARAPASCFLASTETAIFVRAHAPTDDTAVTPAGATTT